MPLSTWAGGGCELKTEDEHDGLLMLTSWLLFVASGAGIVVAGTALSRYGDRIAELTGLGRAWVGMVLMAAASYLAMRAERAPRFLGTHVGSKEGWADLMRRFDRIIDLVQAGTQARAQPAAARSGGSRP